MLSEIDWLKSLNWLNNKVIIGATVIILLLSVFTLMYSRNFYDSLSFSLAAVKNAPHSWMAHSGLGIVYLNRDNYIKAEKELKEAIFLNPFVLNVHYNLGLVYFKEKKWELAESEWKKELEINANNYKSLIGLASLSFQKGNKEEGAKYLQEAERAN